MSMQMEFLTKVTQTEDESYFQCIDDRSTFLRLPLEIRRQIYDTTLGLDLRDQLSLLLTSRQIYDEGYDFILRRPFTCSSRQELQAFVGNFDAATLKKVRCLELCMQDLHPTVMQPYLEKVVMGIIPPPTDHPYSIECAQILSCLQMMPNIKHLSILPPRQRNIKPAPRELTQHLLSEIPHYLQRLQSLSVNVELKSLDFMDNLPHLRSISLLGCLEEDSRNARRTVRSLTALREFTIAGPTKLFLKQRRRSVLKTRLFALTADVLCNAPPLSRLSIHDLTRDGNPTFFTRAMLIAVLDFHRNTLQSFCISTLLRPSCSVLELLKSIVLGLPNLHQLQLEWPGVDSSFLIDCLPPSVQLLTTTVENDEHAQEITKRLMLCKHKLPYLKEIKFNLIPPAQQIMATERKDRISVTALCQSIPNVSKLKSPWKITRGTWQPAGEP